MRRSLALSLSLLLAACATRPTTTTSPSRQPETPVQQEHGPIIGFTADELVRKFGTPTLQIREGDSLKLQFRNPQCVLDAYLYPAGPTYRVTHVDARTRALGAIDQTVCIASLAAR
jgi:hypothetical protein